MTVFDFTQNLRGRKKCENNSWNQLFSNLFSKTVTLTKFLPKCVRENSRNSLSLKKISSNQLFSNFFSKTIAFTKFFMKKVWERISAISHCCGDSTGKTNKKLIQQKIFREINFFKNVKKKPWKLISIILTLWTWRVTYETTCIMFFM